MSFESVPEQEVKKEDLNGYFERIKSALIEKTLKIIELAPDNRKAEALEAAFNFFGAVNSLIHTLDIANIDQVEMQKSMEKLAEKAGLDPEIVSVSEYAKLMEEVKNS